MSSVAALFPPGTDLCKIPGGTPPVGQLPNFDDPGLKPVVISVGVILTTIAVVFGLGRIYVNLRKLVLSDLFVLLTILSNLAHLVTMIVFVKYFRHGWNLPLCWLNGQFAQLTYAWENLLNVSLFCAKAATLLLFRQLFTISHAMNVAIWVGIAATFVINASGLVVTSYFSAPHAGETWDEHIVQAVTQNIIFVLYWSVAQGSASTLLDLYIFILPLPILFRLNLSRRRKVQVIAIFLVAILGVVASVISLVFRVKSIQGTTPDSIYNAGVLLTNNLVEMNIALIICSAPAFSNFMRNNVLESRTFKWLRSTLGDSKSGQSRSNLPKTWDPNHPRTGREKAPNQGYIEMSDTWLFHGDATVDIEARGDALTISSDDVSGLQVLKSVNVEHAEKSP
ncbi:hypothetical protein F4820DRAFT_431969 [Hypoxylon rubiginosum]|uniref:Uncharacterized protein n=1 Tax=Hypoxylon rubiginosum TaxID=110542 RepID=A0ACB9YRD5_9PEZI|nr:hypothetical protein F4820DRAFT_431969 [Hypoxylon rubiginosum]